MSDNFEIEHVVNERIKQWGVDEKTKDLLVKTKEWLDSIKEEDRIIFLRLLSRFKYYSLAKMNTILNDLYYQYKKSNENHEYTLFLPLISSKGVHNHSYDVRSCFQFVTKIDKKAFPTEMKKVIDDYPLSQIKSIVFLDDMTGSGATIKESIIYMVQEYGQIFQNKDIYLVVIEACEDGLNKIDELYTEIGIKVKYIYGNMHRKAFDKGYIFSDTEVNGMKNIVENYERLITRHNNDYVLGFKQTQALMAFYYDTPNNTLSSFWWENDAVGWKPIFPRSKSIKPGWLINIKQKKKRKNLINYNIAKNRD